MKKSSNIICPFCQKEFQLNDAIKTQFEDEIKNHYQEKFELSKTEFENEIVQKYEIKYEKLLEEEQKKIRESANKKAKKEFLVELQEKDEEIAEANKKIALFRKKEKQLLDKEKLLEETKHSMEIEHRENLIKETKKAYEKAQEQLNLEYDLKLKERDKIIDDLNKQMKEGQRKAEQGSMKLQGEVLELELEEILKDYYPNDDITPIAPGRKGGDIKQVVKLPSGKIAGIILWETKRTKSWQANWLQKLKEDQRNLKADLAVIASEVIPSDIKNFGIENGIWITEIKFALGLSIVLREMLINVAIVKTVNSGKENEAEMIFNYLTGTQFKQRVESILEAHVEMVNEIESEKRFMEKSWAKKEKQIEKSIRNISGMCGDLQGISANIPEIKLLEMQ